MKKILLAILPALLLGTAYAQDKQETDEETATTTAKPKAAHKNGNILYISPIKFTENGVGFELGYERAVSADGVVAFNLPVVGTFNMTKNDINQGNKEDPMFYFMPGLKFYPSGSCGKVKYAIGPSFVLGVGQQTDADPIYYVQYSSYYPPTTYTTKDKLLLGVMINNSMNINPSAHFALGLDLGLGFTYISKLDGVSQGMQPLVQGGFKMGYRF